MSMVEDDGDFKKGRFKPALVGIGVLIALGGGAALYLGLKSDSEKMTADQIAETRKGIYVLPRTEQLPRWRRLAESGNTIELQQEALTQLTFLEDKEVIPLAIKALENVDHRARGVAAQALATMGLPAAEPARAPLVKAFHEATDSDKPQIAWALVVLNEKPLWKPIMEIYKAGHLATVERVGGGRAFDPEALAAMASPDEWAALAEDPNEAVKQLVAGILSRTGDKKYTQQLIKLLGDKNDIAREAASGLGKIGDPAAVKPLVEALSKADKDDRQRFLEALRDGIGGEGLVLALPSVALTPPDRNKFQTKQIFDMVRTLADPRASDALVNYLTNAKPTIHWQTEAALRLAENGDIRAVPYLADRLRLDPLKIYDDKADPEYRRDDNERVVSARMLADLAVLHPEAAAELRAKAEDAVLFWAKDRPQPHANALRFLAAAGSTKALPDMREWANPKDALPKEGASGAFPTAFETAHSALRYLGWTKDSQSWGTLEKQLNRKDQKYDITQAGLVGAGMSMLGMVYRGLTVGAAQGFAQWGDPKAYPLLVKIIEDTKQNEGSREESCRSLAFVATDENMKEVVKKARAAEGKDPKAQMLRACYVETILRHPVAGSQATLLEMLNKDAEAPVRNQVARALGFPGLEPATEAALFEKMKDKELMNAAALALIIGGTEDAAARAIAMFDGASKEALDELKDLYFDSFGFWSDDDLAKGRVFRFVANAESIGKVRVKDTLQDWAKLRLGAQFNNLEYDSGPHSMTRVTLRYRLIETAKKGDAAAKKGAIETLKFMKEQGALMALRDEKSDTGALAKKALFELMNPKLVVGEKVPEAKPSKGEGVNVLPPR
jgi:HEAT repeat protein